MQIMKTTTKTPDAPKTQTFATIRASLSAMRVGTRREIDGVVVTRQACGVWEVNTTGDESLTLRWATKEIAWILGLTISAW